MTAARYECDRCHRPIGETGCVRRSRLDGIVLTALCADCLAAGASLRLADTAEPVTPQAGVMGSEPDRDDTDTVTHG